MAAPVLRQGLRNLPIFSRSLVVGRQLSSGKNSEVDPPDTESNSDQQLVDELLQTQDAKPKLTGFAQAYEKHASLVDEDPKAEKLEPVKTQESFATMFRNSAHVHIGSGKDQLVIGKIYHVVDDDLYIDFGGKFHCVCKKPENDPLIHKYHKGTKVRLRLHDVELAQHFIGATHDITLLEADATLLGLLDKRP
ncbi:small ribosomal subunit protein bS1m-like [Ptychodera flava]|uniref:small ribosomal subunit protein bS1m-like n=1 Tax=Ptychodera flava TaxID=63121 RepID=UPI00396A3EEC